MNAILRLWSTSLESQTCCGGWCNCEGGAGVGLNREDRLETHHCGIEEGVVELWIRSQQLASQELCILDVLEQGDLHWVGLIVRQGEGPYSSHSGELIAR